MIRLLLALLLPAALLPAAEGKWTPMQVLELDPAWLRQQGLELPVSRLWDPARGTGLLAAAVNIGGCSAGFVSPTGLIATNHHCLFGVVQQHSQPGRDLITNGFLARRRGDELPARTTRVTVPRRFIDVTREVEAAVPAQAGDLARFRAIQQKQNELVAACEKQPHARCRVAAFDGGVQYVLIETMELRDIRLVYAPPRSVGEFGGEIDNWMWPRHTGDFAMARAYVSPDGQPADYSAANVPYKPEFHFPIAKAGIKTGEFVMVLGYPGTTLRALTAAEMEGRRDDLFRRREALYGEWIRLLEETTSGKPDGEIAVAATLKSLSNRFKNAQGQLAGLRRGRIIEKVQEHESAVLPWAAERPAFQPAAAAKDELDRLAREARATAARDFLFGEISNGALALRHATQLVRLAAERAKPDAEREPAYMDRLLPQVRARLESDAKSYFPSADKALFASFLIHARALPADQRIAAAAKLAFSVDQLYAATRVTDVAERLKMFDETTAQLRARRDPLLEFAFALDEELQAWNQTVKQRDGAIARLRPLWRRAVIAHAGQPVAPDANSTLRVSFAHVQGYAPRDGVLYTPQTTLAGMLEKHTGEDPFDLPEALLTAARRADAAAIPLCFLADGDTTGGNSGSPVVNGRGELVGLNFDRVWEKVANDFGYNPAIARNISVDIHFFLWILREVENASELLEELGLPR